VTGFVSLAGSTLLIRSLGPERWATYSVAYFLIVYLEQAFSWRLLGRLIHLHRPPDGALIGAAAALMQVIGVGVLLFFVVLGQIASSATALPDFEHALVAVGICSYVYALRATSIALLERELSYRWIAVTDAIDHLFFYILALTLVWIGLGLGGVLVALAARGLPSLVVARWRAPTPILGKWLRAAVSSLLHYAGPGLGTGLIVLFEGLVPVFLLAPDYPVELAFTMAAGTIVGYAAVAQFVVQRVGFSGLARLRGTRPAFRRATQSAYDVSTFVLVTMVVPITAFAPVWLPTIFGDEWERAAPVLVAVGAAFMCNGAVYVSSGALLALGRPRAVLWLNCCMFAVFSVGAVVGVGQSPLMGVAVALAVSRALGVAAAQALLRREGVAPRVYKAAAMLAGGVAVSIGVAASVSTDDWIVAGGLTLLAVALWLLLLSRNRRWLTAIMPRQLRETAPVPLSTRSTSSNS
jgi:O-antigen/teichoic acid export membrane protein